MANNNYQKTRQQQDKENMLSFNILITYQLRIDNFRHKNDISLYNGSSSLGLGFGRVGTRINWSEGDDVLSIIYTHVHVANSMESGNAYNRK